MSARKSALETRLLREACIGSGKNMSTIPITKTTVPRTKARAPIARQQHVIHSVLRLDAIVEIPRLTTQELFAAGVTDLTVCAMAVISVGSALAPAGGYERCGKHAGAHAHIRTH